MSFSRDAARQLHAPAASDRQQFERFRAGDATAFELLFRAYAAQLCAFAAGYVHSSAIAEELVQDLFCWLWDHRAETPAPASVRAYLFASLRNRAINHLRRERLSLDFRSSMARASAGSSPLGGADADLLAADLSSALAAAVRRMPTRCREVFTLIRDDHLSYAETAEVLGISPKTVEIHMSRALSLLRGHLAPWLSQ